MKRPIHISLSPNWIKKDAFIAASCLFNPINWFSMKKGKYITVLENVCGEYFHNSNAISFYTGREAIYATLKAMQIQEGDEVLVQAFTCVVVINAIKWTGATPIFVDIEEMKNFNMDSEDMSTKITHKTKAVIIQNTFGQSADIDKITSIAKEKGFKVVMDCAQAFGLRYDGRHVSEYADATIVSFGRDKVLSSVNGGMVITNDEDLYKRAFAVN